MSWSEYPAARVIGEFEDLMPAQPSVRRAPPSSPLLVPYATPLSAAVWDDIPLPTYPAPPTDPAIIDTALPATESTPSHPRLSPATPSLPQPDTAPSGDLCEPLALDAAPHRACASFT